MEHIGKVGDGAVDCGRVLINHNTLDYLFEVSCVLMVTDCSLIKKRDYLDDLSDCEGLIGKVMYCRKNNDEC